MSQRERKTAWERYHVIWVSIKLNRRTDADIINYLDSVPSKMGVIKAALREYMKREND